ncbi:MAG TPA: Type 1 glutamine amidotransferase-like domain-containing protein [Candidatus Saccharimonadales bacterium]|nr:Type 1 glutamine amidotransferase-like domain-containing protein [Candidatus Saccharimonadales bacterium]
MKLFLSSYRAGRHDKELLDFLGPIKKVAIITNAKDYKSQAERKIRVKENFDYWRSIGLMPTEIDLRPYFKKAGAEKLVHGHEFVWLAGGNAFLLRRALSYTGLDRFLIEKVRAGQIIYGGESAGAIMAGPTLHGSEDDSSNEDNPHFVPSPYEKRVLWDSLNFTDFVPVPHYKSAEIGDSIDGYVEYLRKRKIAYKTMTDDQAIVINVNKEEFLG